MALFQSDLKETLRRLSDKEFTTGEERDQLVARLEATEGVRARDVVWMLFRPDRALRDAGLRLLGKLRDPETFDVFVAEARGKPDPATKAAVMGIGGIGLTGIEQRLAQMLAPAKETKDTRELQATARRVLLELPSTPATQGLLWQLTGSAHGDERLPYLTKLAAGEMDRASLSKWQALAAGSDDGIRDMALQVLAARAGPQSIDVLVQQLPSASYNVQQTIVAALVSVGATEGIKLVDRVLPLLASGEASTRTAVMKILLGLGDPAAVVRRYLQFSKTLPGFVRERALDMLRAFGDQIVEPVIGLLADPDPEVRASAIAVASVFDDRRIVPPTIELLRDPDWWMRISAADTLGKLKDPRAVDALVAIIGDADVKWAVIEALGRIGDVRALPALGKMLADPAPDVRIEVIQALRQFNHPQVRSALIQVAENDTNRAVRTRAIDLLSELAAADEQEQSQVDTVRRKAMTAAGTQGEPKLHTLLNTTRNQGASDFHLTVGQPPMVRLAADLLRAQGDPFTAQMTEAMLKEILSEAQWGLLQSEKQLDFCYFIPQGGRYRGNVFLDQKGYNAVFRVIPEKPPTIVEIGLPPQLAEIADYHQGLVLICGPSGSGKSTTLAALVNLFNETRNDHVLTMEDPVEFVHPFKNCLINQREVGTHTVSYARALRAALREDPDVIVIGELRDNDSIGLALTAAETGHIVLGTLNATSAPKAIDRIISSFPIDDQPQVRASLSESLKYVIAQRLLQAKEGRKQVAAFEILKGTSTIANMIRDEKTFQIPSAMQIGRSMGMQTFDDALRGLVEKAQIAPETAYMAAGKKEDFEPLVSAEFLKGVKI